MEDDRKKEIAIWGGGIEGKKLYMKVKNSYRVFAFYDSNKNKWGTSIDGVPVKKYEEEDI